MGEAAKEDWALGLGKGFGEWRVLSRLGRGGMGEVYAVEDAAGLRFALKLFTARGVDAAFLGKRFRDVGAALLRGAHPNLGKILRVGEASAGDARYAFSLMALVAVSPWVREAALRAPHTLLSAPAPLAGEVPATLTAADLLGASQGLPEALLECLYGETLAALRHLHGLGIVHGDVKPGNLLLSAGGHVTLVDFGLARVCNPALRPARYAPTCLNLADAVRGTPEFLAPELLRGAPPSPESDLYALGATLFRLRTGMPYGGAGARLFLRELPEPWRGRLSALLAEVPESRGVPAERLSRRGWTRRAALLGLASGAVALAGGGAWGLWRLRRPTPREDFLSERGHVGNLRVPPGTTLHLPEQMEEKPHLILPAGATAVLYPRREAKDWDLMTRGAELQGGRLVIKGDRRFWFGKNHGTLLMDDGAVLEMHSSAVLYDWQCEVRSGTARFLCKGRAGNTNEWVGGGQLFLYANWDLQVRKGACLDMGVPFFCYDFWKDAPLRFFGGGLLRLTAYELKAQCPVRIEAGTVALLADWAQETENPYYGKNRPCHHWDIHSGATLCGTARLTLRQGAAPRNARVRVHAGGILCGGWEGEGRLALSHATLADGACLRAEGGGCVEVGNLEVQGQVRVEAARARPGPLLTWRTGHPAADAFLPERLPKDYTLHVQGNTLFLRDEHA